MKVQSLVDHRVAGAALQQPEAYLASMPPRWANARGGHVVQPRVGSVSHLPHPFKPLGLWVGPLPHRQVTFCPSPKSLGQVDIFP